MVFDQALLETARDRVVLAHLNHRLVQMCLRLLRAEVWSREGARRLHRATARIVPDDALDEARGDRPRAPRGARRRQPTPARRDHRRGRSPPRGEDRAHEGRRRRPERSRRPRPTPSRPRRSTIALRLRAPREARRRPGEVPRRPRARSAPRPCSGSFTRSAPTSRPRPSPRVLTELALASIEAAKLDEAPVQLALFTDPEREQIERDRDSLRARVERIPAEIVEESAARARPLRRPHAAALSLALTVLMPGPRGARAKGAS